MGLRTPFGRGGYEIAALSAGLAKAALFHVLEGQLTNAYALSGPPGHHALPDWPNGFCLLNNIAIAIRAAQAAGLARRIAVVDWDVHHGNGTEAIFWTEPEVLTISLHQEHNYPLDTGDGFGARGRQGSRVQHQHPAAPRHRTCELPLRRWNGSFCPCWRVSGPTRSSLPAAMTLRPSTRLGGCWPRQRLFRLMTRQVMAAAADLCSGRLVLVHEGGYSELHVPFCGPCGA